jgi:GNAT superfamily N-acetyltransferase
MEYLIRKCERKDLPELIKLCARHANYERSAYDAAGKADKLDNAIFSDQPRLFCLVVEIGKRLSGFASYTFDFSTWDAESFLYLDCLYLDEEFRGLGIGSAIISRLTAVAVQHRCVNIQWQTPSWNDRAIQFYLRAGAENKSKVRFTLSM